MGVFLAGFVTGVLCAMTGMGVDWGIRLFLTWL